MENKKSKDYYIGIGIGLLISVAFNCVESIIIKLALIFAP